jgi:hypothetical protein
MGYFAWAGGAGMGSFADNREQQLEEREQAITNARAAIRAEREQVNADRAEADRLLAEARTELQNTKRGRNRTKQLAKRFMRRLKQKHVAATRQLDEKAAQLDSDRKLLTHWITLFEKAQSEFHLNAAEVQARLREAWNLVRAQQKRAANEWIETNHHFEEENAILSERAATVFKHVKMLVDNRARIEAETAGFREEAVSLEARIANARTALAELELRRDRARVELLGTELPAELANFAATDDFEDREQVLVREKAAVAALKASLERESADINDNRRLVAEQLTMLSQARAKWQHAEQQTVIEMEQLAHELNEREGELNIREQQLIRADVRRREDAFELWQLRLHLETWQTKLTAFEMRWQTEREETEADLSRRVSIMTRKETEFEGTVATWEKARERERERLRAELELWVDDRQRLANAAEDFHRQRLELLGELAQHAARALAAEELVASAIQDSGSKQAKRRLTVLRKRWERAFDRKVREIEHRGDEAAKEHARIDDRYRELQAVLMEVVDREATQNKQLAADLRKETPVVLQLNDGKAAESKNSLELTALRNEVERLSTMLIDIEVPEPPEAAPPVIDDSWAAEDSPTDEVWSFDSEAQAA